jgi:hypothetical protein
LQYNATIINLVDDASNPDSGAHPDSNFVLPECAGAHSIQRVAVYTFQGLRNHTPATI